MSGLPKRNWDAEDFICRQCRSMTSKSSSSGHPASFLSLGMNSKTEQVHGSQVFYDPPRNYPNSVYYQNSPSNARYPHDHPDIQTAVSSHSYTPQPRPTGVTFAHYQPQQGGFSTSRPTYSLQDINSPQHARYTITPHTVSSTGVAPYPSTFHVRLPSTFYEHISYASLSSDTSYISRTLVPFFNVPSHHQFVSNEWRATPSRAGDSAILQWARPPVILPSTGSN